MTYNSSSPDPSSLYKLVEKLDYLPSHSPERFETIDGYDDPTCSNRIRVSFAVQALAIFQEACHMLDETDVAAADLISDLLHLVHSLHCSPKDVLETALTNFVAEAG
jgi:hypothetical protein